MRSGRSGVTAWRKSGVVMRSTRVRAMLLASAVLLALLQTNASAFGPPQADSLSSAIPLDFQAAGQVDFTHTTLASPEPRALALFGAGLLGIVHVARRRRRSMSRT